jgi:23S rRNA (adenine2503-C2)-methyltransferase
MSKTPTSPGAAGDDPSDLQDLYGLDAAELGSLPCLAPEPAYRARQIEGWIYGRGARSFAEMTDLPKNLRERLEASCRIGRLEPIAAEAAADGGATKYLFALADGLRIEAVWIRDGERDTLCISSQAGCAYGCTFCATATMKAGRNLTAGEILAQVAALRDAMAAARPESEAPAHNVVFMGMGEPLANYENLLRSLRLLTGEHGFGIGDRRITVSTVGLEPEIRRLAEEPLDVRLAFSLNATTDELRSSLMPVNRKYPIGRVLDALAEFQRRKGRPVTLEYVLLRGVNDSAEDARRLAGFARQLPCKVNLISYNPHPYAPYEPVSDPRIEEFRTAMLPIAPRVTITVRWSKGREIQAACGQLATSHGAPAR